jgi:cation transport protein ChaC
MAKEPSADIDRPLSRELLSTGDFARLIARDNPGQIPLTEAERQASLAATLAAKPAGDVWLFAYGSLIWNATVEVAERRPARVAGWHRSFCLTARAGRGSAANPGLVLGLDAGGYCDGIALRLADDKIRSELEILWHREMVVGSYQPRWLELLDEAGRPFGHGLAFTMDREMSCYAGHLPQEVIIHRLATAKGSIGSSADYLFRTRDALQGVGIHDPLIEDLAMAVSRHPAQQR